MKMNNRGCRRILAILLPMMMCLGCATLAGCGDGDGVVVHVAGSEIENSSQSGSATSVTDGAGHAAESGRTDEVSVGSVSNSAAVPADAENNNPSVVSGQADSSGETDHMYIYVCGAVRVPGVYELPSGSRIYQAIAAAGGLTEEADDRSLNQAQVLTDGQQVTVYTREEAKSLGLDKQPVIQGIANADDSAGQTGSSNTALANGGSEGNGAGTGTQAGNSGGQSGRQKVNLNTASAEELMTLPGIGEVRAAAIIQYREENGGFSSVEDIKNIDGIKDKAFNKIKDYIEV